MRNLLLLTGVLLALGLSAQQKSRKAIMGLLLKPVENGLQVDSVIPETTGSALKIKKGDVVTSLNSNSVKTIQEYTTVATQFRADDKVSFDVIRNGKKVSLPGKAVMRPYEKSDIADITYDWVKFRKGYLRTIVRKPKGKDNLPCVLLIPGYGCGSIENYSTGYNGKLINEWLKNGYAVVTVEKSGLGDSYDCESCFEADLVTDIESFDAGYKYMETLSFVDKSKLYIWGHSLGGMVAPEIAKRHSPKGVMVFGTVFRPWSEFLLEMHRVQKPLLEGMSYEETEKFIRQIQKVYFEFFVLKKTLKQLYEIPEYKEIVAGEMEYKTTSNNMWGRHWRFWQQIDSLNLAESWKNTNCPVLVINGGTDYEQCAPIEPILIEQTVNEAHPGTATRVQIDDLDHFMMVSKTYKEAVENFRTQQYTKGNFNTKITDEIIKWMKEVNDLK
ncbi:MAG TPA: alpha/beta fold hydrolase [Bacteroidia bacterium]